MFVRKGQVLGSVLIEDVPKPKPKAPARPKPEPKPEVVTESKDSVAKSTAKSADK